MSNKNRQAAKQTPPTIEREATTAAPVAATVASEAASAGETVTDLPTGDVVTAETQTTEQTEEVIDPAITAAAETRKSAIAVVQPAADAKPAKVKSTFEVQLEKRAALFAMSDAELLEGNTLKDVEGKDNRIFAVHPTNIELQDQLVGSDLSRSGIRSAVIAFLKSRPDEQAPANVIAAYMQKAVGIAYKGKFNTGYLAAKGADVRRGMVARKQLVIVAGKPAEPESAPVEEPAADKDEE